MRFTFRHLLMLVALAAFCVHLPDAIEAAIAAPDPFAAVEAFRHALTGGVALALITNQEILDGANKTFRGKFEEIFAERPPGNYDVFTEVVPTDSEENEIDVIGAMPEIEEWVGPKSFKAMRAYRATATLKSYQKSLRLPFKKVRYDRNGFTGRAIGRFLGPAGEAGAIYDKICTDALIANGTGYDEVAIFSSSHPHGPAGATQSNTSTTALSFAQHEAVMVAGASLRDEYSRPFGIGYNVLMVGPKLAKLGMEITGSKERLIAVDNTGAETGTRVAAGTIPNVWGPGMFALSGGSMLLIINYRLVGTYDDYYYYFDTTRGAKPIILYEGRKPESHEQTEMSDEGRFLHNELRWSVECDVVGAPGDWHVAYAGIVA
jgi:phage major head subunit gpT-like protein